MQWRDAQPADRTAADQLEIFEEALCLKKQLFLDEDSNNNRDTDQPSVNILADLQDSQDKEVAYLLKDLPSKALNTLKQLRHVQTIARFEHWHDNVAVCLLGVKRTYGGQAEASEDDFVDALHSKYAELKNKLFVEMLKRYAYLH